MRSDLSPVRQVATFSGGVAKHLHIFDPTGGFLFSADPTAAGGGGGVDERRPPVARRYALGRPDTPVFSRFPDQFAPFLSLHAALAPPAPFGGEARAGAGAGTGRRAR